LSESLLVVMVMADVLVAQQDEFFESLQIVPRLLKDPTQRLEEKLKMKRV
jgi:hypothetical protein